jgi:mannose-6-phosphate isomerase-like protein (cupin superfamily)/DNA-binding XRE family transcriptional regulator
MGVSLRQMARELQVSASYLSQLETGKTQPSVATLFAICGSLHISVEDLFSEQESGAPFSAPDTVEALNTLRNVRPSVRRASRSEGESGSTGSANLPSPLVRPSERQTIVLDSGVVWERLTPTTGAKTNFLFVRYAPGGSSTSDEKLMRHAGTEYWYVLRGVLEVVLGFETYRVAAGDAISFDSTTPHRLTNPGDTPAEAIWFDQDIDGLLT